MVKARKNSLFLLLVVSSICGGTDRNTETWVSSSLDRSSLESSTVQRQSYMLHSQLNCLSLATMVEWAYVACFYPAQTDGECMLWALQALDAGSVVKDPTLGRTDCKTTLRNAVCLEAADGTLTAFGEVTPDDAFCPDNRNSICTQTGLLRSPEPLVSCSSPFAATPIGCIFISTTPHIWCKARSECLDLGGDLMSFDTSTDFEAMRTYLASVSVSGDMWAGLRFENGAWGYLSNGRYPGARSAGDWSTNNPDGGAETCCYIAPSMLYKMADKQCTLLKRFICHARNAA